MLTVFIRNKEQQSIIKYKTCTWYGHPEQSQFSILTYGNVIVFFNVDNYILILFLQDTRESNTDLYSFVFRRY